MDEDAAIDGFADVVAEIVGDGTIDAIDFVAADLTGGDPIVRGAEARRSFGSLRELDFHEAGDGAQVGGDGNCAVMDFERIKAEGDAAVGRGRCFLYGEDCAEDFGALGDFSVIGKRNALHEARGDGLSRFGGFGRESVIETNGKDGARRDLQRWRAGSGSLCARGRGSQIGCKDESRDQEGMDDVCEIVNSHKRFA